jgi:hypothetical protein
MRILLLSFYFEPDLCACSFRATPFVRALSKLIGNDGEVDVITTLPNRYQSYQREALETEIRGNVRISRIQLPSHKSGFVDQSLAFSTFAKSVIAGTQGKDYDVVFATSSRLFTASLGAYIARRKKARLYLDIRDIFSETIRDVLPRGTGRFMFPLFSLLERLTLSSAARINLVSEGFRDYFPGRYPKPKYSYITNGIDDEFLGGDYRKAETTAKKVVLYAGNIGEGQGLERVIPEGAKRMGSGYEFWIVGDGGRRPKLEQELARLGVDNVRLLPPVSRAELLKLYAKADYLFLHLNDYPAFRRVLPSKIFEYAATGKAILAGVAGYAAHFIQEHVSNAAVFKPCDVDGFCSGLAGLNPAPHERADFVANFTRTALMDQLAASVVALMPAPVPGRSSAEMDTYSNGVCGPGGDGVRELKL